jgi:hypothetical protein
MICFRIIFCKADYALLSIHMRTMSQWWIQLSRWAARHPGLTIQLHFLLKNDSISVTLTVH